MSGFVSRGEGPDPQPNDGAPQEGVAAIPSSQQALPLRSGKPDPTEMLPRIIGWYKVSRDHYQVQRQEMAEAFDLTAGHQWAEEDLQILQDQMRPAITFNRIG
ncbi:MAG: hypothetical protein KGL39_57325, partial [Patescibacteria group bacterium]|nr:hypothetical protein [Patescibacteria group bacterium]